MVVFVINGFVKVELVTVALVVVAFVCYYQANDWCFTFLLNYFREVLFFLSNFFTLLTSMQVITNNFGRGFTH